MQPNATAQPSPAKQNSTEIEKQRAAFQASTMAKIKQDPYLSAFLFSSFNETPKSPSVPNSANETQPTSIQPLAGTASNSETQPSIEASHLVTVEVWNVILGKEKTALLVKAQALGASELPDAKEWAKWKLVVGNIENNPQKMIVFFAPPEFEKFKNGDQIVVEIAMTGGVHRARYLKNAQD